MGGGHVGLCTAITFAQSGHAVVVADADVDRVAAVQASAPPFEEPGLADALKAARKAGRLDASGDVAAAAGGADVAILCVGTPTRGDGTQDVSMLQAAAIDVGRGWRSAKGARLAIVKSTVLPGTTRDVVGPALRRAMGSASSRLRLATMPEFLREGSALADARAPNRIVIGADDAAARRAARALVADASCPVLASDTATAEMTKFASNAMLAVRLSASNELANACTRLGIDWQIVARGVGADARIGPHYMGAGAGFGGSCLPKDVAALRTGLASLGLSPHILDATMAVNDGQPGEIVRLVREELGALAGRRIALLGLTFKENTDDVRSTPAAPMAREMVAAGAVVVVHDPSGATAFLRLVPEVAAAETWQQAVAGADAVVVQAAWPQYGRLPLERLRRLLRTPIVVDGRRVLDAAACRRAGLRYRAVGYGVA